jgi:hypothetical protein
MLDGGKSAEKQVAGVGHDGGATRSDLVTGEELQDPAETVVNVNGGANSSTLPISVAAKPAASRFFL